MKKFFLFAYLLISSLIFSQNCPYIGPDITLPCGIQSTQLTADFSQCQGSGTSPLATTTYQNTQIPYVAQTNTGTSLTMTDDSQQGPLPIGFTFCFFGNTYTQFYIGSNGWISFSPNQPTSYTSAQIPSNTTPVNSIMAAWQDWHPGLGGQIRYQLQGTAPCRKLVVSWINVPFYNCTTTTGTFHIVLYESTNVIEVHIQNKQFCAWANGTAVQGIQNSNGTQAVPTPGRNSQQWTAQNDGRRWTPSGAPVTATPTWYQIGNPVAIGTGLTITVTPPATGAYYTCRMEYPSCFQGWNSCNATPGQNTPDTIFVVPGLSGLPQPQTQITNPTCQGDCDGQINLTPIGGQAPYIINWQSGQIGTIISGLCQGQYIASITDAQGCQVTTTPIILTDPQQPQLNQLTGPDTVCIYSQSEIFQTDNNPGWDYQWTSTSQILTESSSQATINFSTSQANTTQTTGVIGINPQGCPTPQLQITTFVLEFIPQIAQIGPFCQYDICQNIFTSPPFGGQLTGPGVQNGQFCPQSATIGLNPILYEYNQSGCQFQTTINVMVNPIPDIIEITPDNSVIQVCDGLDSADQSLTLTSNPPSDMNLWIVNGDTTQSFDYIGLFGEGITQIEVIAEANGCYSDPQTTTVNIIKCPDIIYYVPNTFTPDGDEHNQTFGVVFTSGFNPQEFHIEIFDRWGELIWESFDPTAKWDGSYYGTIVQSGIYNWKIRFGNEDNDGFNLITGHLNVLR
jgi:gliding motility-associated-like protein